MRIVLQIISILALAFTVIPACTFLMGSMDLDRLKWILLLCTIAWFVCAPFWVGVKKNNEG